jgi:hypothetical protein
MDLQANTQNVPSSYYAIAPSGQGFGIFKVTAHNGELVEKGPIIRHYMNQHEAAATVRDMNYGKKAA